jgi:hypothetical protein
MQLDSSHKSNNLTLTMDVSLRRQVKAEVKGQAVWKSSLIGSGTLTALPPSIEIDPCESNPQESSLDWEGEIQCRDEIRVGHFNAGDIAVMDFLVFSILPKSHQAAFNSMRIVVPVSLVTDTCH